MAETSKLRPAHLVALLILAPPAWKAYDSYANRPNARPLRAENVAAGKELFEHKFVANDPMTGGDGLGPVFNAASCVDCHNQGGSGGGGANEKNVTVYGVPATPERTASKFPLIGVIHQKAVKPEFQELLSMASPGLPSAPSIPLEKLVDRSASIPAGVTVTQRNTPALFGDGLLDAIPEETLHAEQRRNSTLARVVGLSRAKDSKIRGRVARLPDGRIGRFGWKAEFASLSDFVRAACANELGLSNPTRPQATPLGRRSYVAKGTDLTEEQCDLMTDYLRDLPAPRQVVPSDPVAKAHVEKGETLFREIGCADCHVPDLGPIKGFYSNLLLHDLGADLSSATGYYGAPPPPPAGGSKGTPEAVASEWKTPPLWGVADSGPYLHDGRAETLDVAIQLHGGEASDVTKRYENLSEKDQDALVAFLKTLRAPGPADKAESSGRVADNR